VWALHNLTAGPISVASAALGAEMTSSAYDLLAGGPVDLAAPIEIGPYGVRWIAQPSSG
jgi:hypothetical protein